MKKALALLLTVISLLSLAGCFPGSISNYSEHGEIDGFYVSVNQKANRCFVGGFECIEYTDNMELTIPNEYKGIPITQIGGYFGRGVPSPFYISVADLYMNAPPGSDYEGTFSGNIHNFNIPVEYNVETLVFNLNIGKNIEEVEYVSMHDYYPHINEDGTITFYQPAGIINCSEENKHFYSKDGKLYDKNTNELITDFVYSES